MRRDTCGNDDTPGCGQPFIWLRHTTTGKWAPIEPEPSGDGNCAVNLEREEYWIPGHSQAFQYQGQLHLNHWFRCPAREEWRKRVEAQRRKPSGQPT